MYTVFDVETPNRHNDRICSIGLALVEDGAILRSAHFLVNPECEFDPVNIGIHGIHPEDVQGQPSFAALWSQLERDFTDNVVVAHNASFDLSVLRKTLEHYALPLPEIKYLDTMRLIRSYYPDCPNCRLETVSQYLHLHLEHHHAGSDALAAAEVLIDMLRRSPADKNVQLYVPCSSHASNPSIRLSSTSLRLLELKQLLDCIVDDDSVSIEEFWTLYCWMRDNSDLKGNYPYDDIYALLVQILDDGTVDSEELESMLTRICSLLDPVGSACSAGIKDVRNMNIVLSGEFARGSKSEIEAELIACGATIQRSIVKKTDLVLVGSVGNSSWAGGTYGTKIKKALELQSQGCPIQIVREKDFFQ